MKSKVKQAPKVQEVEVKQAHIQAEMQTESTKLEGDQTIIGIGGNLIADKEYTVSGHTAQVLIDKGFATLKQ
jgi:hypothetical protein